MRERINITIPPHLVHHGKGSKTRKPVLDNPLEHENVKNFVAKIREEINIQNGIQQKLTLLISGIRSQVTELLGKDAKITLERIMNDILQSLTPEKLLEPVVDKTTKQILLSSESLPLAIHYDGAESRKNMRNLESIAHLIKLLHMLPKFKSACIKKINELQQETQEETARINELNEKSNQNELTDDEKDEQNELENPSHKKRREKTRNAKNERAEQKLKNANEFSLKINNENLFEEIEKAINELETLYFEPPFEFHIAKKNENSNLEEISEILKNEYTLIFKPSTESSKEPNRKPKKKSKTRLFKMRIPSKLQTGCGISTLTIAGIILLLGKMVPTQQPPRPEPNSTPAPTAIIPIIPQNITQTPTPQPIPITPELSSETNIHMDLTGRMRDETGMVIGDFSQFIIIQNGTNLENSVYISVTETQISYRGGSRPQIIHWWIYLQDGQIVAGLYGDRTIYTPTIEIDRTMREIIQRIQSGQITGEQMDEKTKQHILDYIERR